MKHSIINFCAACAALCGLFTAPSFAQDAPTAPDGMHLFLLIGQSNMAGRGKVEPQDTVTNPRIWMLTKNVTWVLAKDPLHFDKPAAGVGLASEFARTLAKADPAITIGLIPCAFGGTSLDQWNPKGQLYKDALTRTREAMKKGKLAGILWHQGESDINVRKVNPPAPYAVRFAAMIAQLRQDLDAPDVPVVVGELGRYRPTFEAFNATLPAMVQQVPNCALATSEDLTDRGDNLHFNSASLRIFGQRYAAAFLKLQTPIPAAGHG